MTTLSAPRVLLLLAHTERHAPHTHSAADMNIDGIGASNSLQGHRVTSPVCHQIESTASLSHAGALCRGPPLITTTI